MTRISLSRHPRPRCTARRLWEIEARGGSFVIVDNGFDVEPDSTLTATDRAFILRHLDEAIKIVHLQEADDGRLYEA